MTKQGCFTVAVRAHELHTAQLPYFSKKSELKSWDQISWYFLFLWEALE